MIDKFNPLWRRASIWRLYKAAIILLIIIMTKYLVSRSGMHFSKMNHMPSRSWSHRENNSSRSRSVHSSLIILVLIAFNQDIVEIPFSYPNNSPYQNTAVTANTLILELKLTVLPDSTAYLKNRDIVWDHSGTLLKSYFNVYIVF